MEELESKLNSNNPIIISQVFSKIVQNILQNHESVKDTEELKFLKEKCTQSNTNISLQAAEAILHLIKANKTDPKTILNDFLTTIATTKCPNNVAFLINNLLILEMEQKLLKESDYKCPYNLKMPQHPFIIIYNESILSWNAIYKEISVTLRNSNEKSIPYLFELYKPFFLFIICNPTNTNTFCKEKFWSLIIGYSNYKNVLEKPFLNTFLPWMQLEIYDGLEANSDLLIELSELNLSNMFYQPELLLLWQAATLLHLLQTNSNPLAMIYCIEDGLYHYQDLKIVDPILIILAKSSLVCSGIYLGDLLVLIHKSLIRFPKIGYITSQILKSCILQWVANPSLLANNAIEICEKILGIIEKLPKICKNQRIYYEFYIENSNILNTNSEVYFSVQTAVILERFRSETDIKSWLNSLNETPNFFLQKIIHLLYGLFLSLDDPEINLEIFELIRKAFEGNKQLSSHILTLILYKLSNSTNPQLHLVLLRALPKMAAVKHNLFKITGTIQALSKGPNALKSLTTSLMFDLWKTDNKSYGYLEKFLVAPVDQQNKREFYITRAFVLKELCALKPELYGKEIVAHLSKILNECNNPDGDISCALAIDGIGLLCKSEIIDAVTTWSTLSPMFHTENRTIVMKSICGLIAEIPSLSYSEAYPQLQEEVVKKLWQYIQTNENVLSSALSALSHFNLDLIVSQMPEDYLEPEMAALRSSGQPIPGIIWVHFLKQFTGASLPIASNFLIQMVAIESANFLKFVYQVKGIREPTDFSALPQNSIVRGLTAYIKSKLLKWKGGIYEEIYLKCLRILSQEYSKPLPPLDWCFLQEIADDSRATDFCVDIAAHQVMLSGTARRFIVNLIEAVTDENSGNINRICRNLKYIANSVQPFTLKPFLQISIGLAVDLYKNNDKEMLHNILDCIEVTLKDSSILEANKTVIAEIINDNIAELDNDSELFKLFLKCIVLFPSSCISSLIAVKSIKEISNTWLVRAVTIRTNLAMNSLNYLNELIEIESSHLKSKYIFNEFLKVFIKHKDNTEAALWLYDLLGQIQAIIIDKTDKKQIMFLCDIFFLATIAFSGHLILVKNIHDKEEMRRVFPRAISTLLDVNHWSICTIQALEWFYHMIINKLLPGDYENVFKESLQCLKQDGEFKKNMKWIKYMNVEFCY